MIFTRARVSLALLSLRKNGDYSQSIYFESSLTVHILLFNGYEDTKLLYVLLVSFLPRYVVNNTFDLVPPRFFCLFEGYDSTVFLLNVSSNQFCSASTPKRFKIKHQRNKTEPFPIQLVLITHTKILKWHKQNPSFRITQRPFYFSEKKTQQDWGRTTALEVNAQT